MSGAIEYLKKMLEEESTMIEGFGSDAKMNYAVKIDGMDNNYYIKPFGHQIDSIKKIKEFKNKAKKGYVGAKGISTMRAVKQWVKENKPSQYYASWQKDSKYYKDDTVEIFYI